tara:strand:- start:512 stop:715 length:204 start_codon:yes stop_codon:yes gene_type:complete
MNGFNTYWVIAGLILILIILYIIKQVRLEREIALKDTTLESLEEKLKKHKLVGGRHKRTNKKNPPIV